MAGIPRDRGAVIWARRVAGIGFDEPVDAMLEAALSDGAD